MAKTTQAPIEFKIHDLSKVSLSRASLSRDLTHNGNYFSNNYQFNLMVNWHITPEEKNSLVFEINERINNA